MSAAVSRPPRVFISRTTAGLKDLADEVAAILRERGIKVIIQTEFLPDWRSVPQMLQQQLGQSDAVIALIGPAHGGEPDFEPARLNDKRTHGRSFSFTQWEYLVARDLKRPTFTFILSGVELIATFPKESAVLARRQQQFIADFPKDRSALFYEFTERQKLLDYIRAIEFEITVLAGKPCNIPYASLGSLFKGRDPFLTELRQHLTAEAPVVIKGKRTIHGMGGVGKTRTAIEYAWKHADDYNALLFITADTPDALHRNIAALCGPSILNLPEQTEKEQSQQVEATLRWLRLHPGWFLIIDNVDDDLAAEETKALLGKLSTGHVVITSRIGDWTGQVKSFDLDVLSDTASIEFLDERTAERRIKIDTDGEDVKTLVILLDGLALALEQAGAHISTAAISYADYIALWEAHRPTVLAWHDEEKMMYPKSLAITYETSVDQLSPGAKELFQILSWFAPDPIPRYLLAARPNPKGESRHLGEIERLHLARYLGDGKRFTVHRLIQEMSRERQELPSPPPALETTLEWVNKEMPTDTYDVRTWRLAEPLVPHAVTAATFGIDAGIAEPCSRLLTQSALLLNAKANHRAAEPLFRRALVIDEAVHGGSHPEVAVSLNNLASLLQATNRLSEAEPLMRRAIAIEEAVFGSEHVNVARHLGNLVALLQATNRVAEAEPLMRRSLAIHEAAYSGCHPMVSKDLNSLAQLLQGVNLFAEAEPLMRRALAIDEAHFGNDHPTVALRANNLAQLLHTTNRLTEAEPLMRRALAIDEASYGTEHPNVARDLSGLARLLQNTNRIAEAEPMLHRALVIDEATYGSEHPRVAVRLSNLALLLLDTNRYDQAETMLRRALLINENSFGAVHPKVANNLSNIVTLLHATNRSAEAEPLMRRALAIDELSFGTKHPSVAIRLNNLAAVVKSFGRSDEAESLMRRALSIDEASFGHDHPNVARDLNNLAQLLHATNRNNVAEEMMRRALAIDEASLGPEHSNVARDLNNLARLLQSTNRVAEAEPVMRRMMEIILRISRDSGHQHPNLSVMICNYINLLVEMGEVEQIAEETVRALAAPYGISF